MVLKAKETNTQQLKKLESLTLSIFGFAQIIKCALSNATMLFYTAWSSNPGFSQDIAIYPLHFNISKIGVVHKCMLISRTNFCISVWKKGANAILPQSLLVELILQQLLASPNISCFFFMFVWCQWRK